MPYRRTGWQHAETISAIPIITTSAKEVMFFKCWFVCLFASNVTQKVINGLQLFFVCVCVRVGGGGGGG